MKKFIHLLKCNKHENICDSVIAVFTITSFCWYHASLSAEVNEGIILGRYEPSLVSVEGILLILTVHSHKSLVPPYVVGCRITAYRFYYTIFLGDVQHFPILRERLP